jgi:hypothetical protein
MREDVVRGVGDTARWAAAAPPGKYLDVADFILGMDGDNTWPSGSVGQAGPPQFDSDFERLVMPCPCLPSAGRDWAAGSHLPPMRPSTTHTHSAPFALPSTTPFVIPDPDFVPVAHTLKIT